MLLAKASVPTAIAAAGAGSRSKESCGKLNPTAGWRVIGNTSMDPVLELEAVSKCFQRYRHPRDRLWELLFPRTSRVQTFQALENISLQVEPGRTIGIVGRNGAGKSTLLQIVAGTLTPSSGRVKVRGRVAALLELGSGFNPEFTGRQNVFFNGQLLGLTPQEIRDRFAEIVAFAEIGDFLDQPVKTYSSGMMVRLAFSVVAHLDPELLIVDEALAVGDARFQARCMKRIRELKEKGTTILFVSHDANAVRMLCDEAVLLEGGRILERGNPNWVLNHYNQLLGLEDRDNYRPLAQETQQAGLCYVEQAAHPNRHGNGRATISKAWLSGSGLQADKVLQGGDLTLTFQLQIHQDLPDALIGLSIRNLYGVVIYGTNNLQLEKRPKALAAGSSPELSFRWRNQLNAGVYTISIAITSEDCEVYDWIDEALVFEVVNDRFCEGVIDLGADLHWISEFSSPAAIATSRDSMGSTSPSS